MDSRVQWTKLALIGLMESLAKESKAKTLAIPDKMAGVIDDASWPMCLEVLEQIAVDYSDWMITLYSGDTRAGSEEETTEPSQGAAEKLIMDVVFEPEADELYSDTLTESCQYDDDV